ncbi:MAG: DUF2281 domain-containing protein [Magnetococcales bacterium]|nr:DUF2281 domain-containing protein [Magnetococcales bacterium]MBF0156910.1 DUF2281 domain-containing protein [Magnetococcales bacterium]
MSTAERIYDEVKRLPDDLADRVLDFVLFLEQRHTLERTGPQIKQGPGSLPVPDTWSERFDREEANAGSAAMAALLADPYPPKGDGLPVKREDIYDRACLR